MLLAGQAVCVSPAIQLAMVDIAVGFDDKRACGFVVGQRASGLTRGHNVGHALAGRQEDQELPKVGEHAEVQEEHQREVEEGGGAQIEPCMHSSTGSFSTACSACTG